MQVDIDQGELDKAPRVGQVLCCDVAGPAFPLVEEVDLAFSKFLAEHVHDAPQFLRNVSRMLKPGRMYVQLSPLLYTVPFVANRLIPDRLGSVLLDVFQSRDRVMYDKFPALYRLCRGPARSTSDAWKRPGCASSPLEGTSATNLQFEESLTR